MEHLTQYIELFITALIAIALYSPLAVYVNDAFPTNDTSISAVLGRLIPMLFIIVLVVAFVLVVTKHK